MQVCIYCSLKCWTHQHPLLQCWTRHWSLTTEVQTHSWELQRNNNNNNGKIIIIIKCKTNQLMIIVGSLLISGALNLFFLVDWCGQEESFGNVCRYELPWLMLVFLQKFILGMLTNFGSMALDRIHNTLKVKGFNWTLKVLFSPLFIEIKLPAFCFWWLPQLITTLYCQMFCVAEPAYDKSLHQLQSFLSGLISEEKLELRDGMYFLKK